jgi:DNA polymerase-3 subunit epsilon
LRFLEAAFDRNGTPVTLPTYLCTLQLANDLPRVPSRRLGDLCVWYGIRLNHAHSAYADALATRELFFHLLPDVGGWSAVAPVLDEYSVQAGQFRWPDLRASGVSYTRADASRDAIRNCSYLASLVSRLPSQPSSRKLASGYLALLDRVLEDRRVEPREAEALVSLAGELGLSPGDVGTAHDDYLVSLVAAALADGVVSKGELEDLSSVAELLGIHRARLDEMIASEERVRKNGCSLRTPAIPPVNLRGKSVCFTGEFTCTISGRVPSREEVEAMASAAGLVVKSGVSKKLDVLVTADPFSLSGKARKAREYGTRILAEAAFWHAIDVRVE